MFDLDKNKTLSSDLIQEVDTVVTTKVDDNAKKSLSQCGTKQEMEWLFDAPVSEKSIPFVFLTHR